VKVGATYRSRIDVEVDDGRATFTQIPTGDPVLDALIAANLPANQAVHTELVFPAILSLGLAWDPNPTWTLALDGVWSQWSAFEKLPLRFPADPALDRDIIEKYDDTFAVRLGAEHRLEYYTYRFGYYFDPAAAPVESVTPLLPDADRHGVTLGLGLTRGAWTFDAYNLFLFVQNRSTEQRERDGYDGTYKTYVNALGASLAYRWGGKE
jgi:long-chain fatty acid transport protein